MPLQLQAKPNPLGLVLRNTQVYPVSNSPMQKIEVKTYLLEGEQSHI